jgi:hypothetical protein
VERERYACRRTIQLTIVALLLERIGDAVVDLLVVLLGRLEVLDSDALLLRVEVVGGTSGSESTDTDEEAVTTALLGGRRGLLR